MLTSIAPLIYEKRYEERITLICSSLGRKKNIVVRDTWHHLANQMISRQTGQSFAAFIFWER